MRRFNFVIAFCFLLLFVLSNGAAKDSGSGENTPSQPWEYRGIPVLGEYSKITDFPLASYNPPPDKSIRSMFTGTVVDDSFKQRELNIFNDRLIVQIEMNYVLYNENRSITYYVIVFDFKKNAAQGKPVVPGDVLGYVEKSSAKMLVFSKTLDPYLVLNSNSPPAYYAGYFWFNPSFLSATGPTKWITFDPVDDMGSKLAEIACHVRDKSPGLAVYNQKVRFRTKLSQYPRGISDEERKSISAYESIIYGRNGIIADITEIKADGYTYLLCWQNGFQDYLKKEYTLNDDIWLYGVIVTYNVWEKKGYVFLRDFTMASPEEMYEGRIKELKGKN